MLSSSSLGSALTPFGALTAYPKSLWAYSEVSATLELRLFRMRAVADPPSLPTRAQLTTGVGGWHHDPALHLSKPFGFSSFGKEISSSPRAWAARTGDLQFYRYHEQGGHFAALEQPEQFAKDMKDCFAAIWPRST